jgi:hypothetical protein
MAARRLPHVLQQEGHFLPPAPEHPWCHRSDRVVPANHSQNQYRDGDAYPNTIEGFSSVFKRGMTGVYQHGSSQHLHRLSEFDFRYHQRTVHSA